MEKGLKSDKQWILVRFILSLVRPLGAISVLFAFVAILGYWGNEEILYRPFKNGPATNPLTAITIILLGLALYESKKDSLSIWLQRIFSILALLVSALRLIDILFNVDISALITPFHDLVSQEGRLGKNNSMGINTAIMLCSTALAIILSNFNKKIASQLIASVSLSIPMITFVGYAYGLDNFYGQMSIMTATAGLPLSFSSLALTANHGFFRALLSPYVAGKIARYQIALGYLIPILFGYILIRTLLISELSIFSLFVVATCWFIVVMVCISSFYIEKVDLQRRRNEKKLEHAAMNDSLTGLPNRRKFFSAGDHEIIRAHRLKSKLWVLMLDIDHFKKINDTAGHETGDNVLKEISQILKSSLREVDLIGRLGGEEFGVILTDIPQKGAARVAETIRSNIEKASIEGWTDIYGALTISIGCASVDNKSTLEQILKKADEALYYSKNKGRNQTTFFDDIECRS